MVTTHKNQMGHSWYEATVDRVDYPPLQGWHEANVAVIGGGYTGLYAALELACAGASVIVLENYGSGDTQSNVKRFFGVQGVPFDHFLDDAEESVGDASEGAGVLVVSVSQRMANHFADAVALDDDHGPVVGGFDLPRFRGESSLDQDGLSGALGGKRGSEVASQGFQVGLPDAVESFGEDDGQDSVSDDGNGLRDFDGGPVFRHRDLVDNLLDLVSDALALVVDCFEFRDDSFGDFGDGFDGSQRGRDGFRASCRLTKANKTHPPLFAICRHVSFMLRAAFGKRFEIRAMNQAELQGWMSVAAN